LALVLNLLAELGLGLETTGCCVLF